MASTSTSLFNVEIEAHTLANLLQHPATFGDFYLIDRGDFSKVHQPLWEMISLQLNCTPPGSVSPVVLAEKLKGLGITLEGFEAFDYLQGLTTRFVEKTEAPQLARELKRLTVRRQLVEKLDGARKELVSTPNASFESMGSIVEKALSSVTTDYYKPETTEVFENMVRIVEERAAKPLKPEEMGFLGPFKSINETIGSLSYHGSYTVVGARSAVGKSSLGWFYQTYLLEQYPQTHLLHLDAAEMTFEELCWRAVCAMSKGQIPYNAIYRGSWANDPAWAKLIRGELWPRAQKMVGRMGFKNVGNMSPKERISFIRRYYYNKVGRGNHLLIHDDYLKGVEATGKYAQEHQTMGFYVGDQKTLITDEIIASLWTSVQANRMGVTNGKKESEINESDEIFSLSDRILQQSTHSFAMRPKMTEELAREASLFGNLVLKPLKKRQLLGDRYQEMISPVKMPSGKFVSNLFNLETKGFWYEDRGTLKEMLANLGQSAVNMSNTDNTAKVQPL